MNSEGNTSGYSNHAYEMDNNEHAPSEMNKFKATEQDVEDDMFKPHFWSSRPCRIVGFVGIVVLLAGLVVICVCAAGHCSDGK